jgi:hypothetical protein
LAFAVKRSAGNAAEHLLNGFPVYDYWINCDLMIVHRFSPGKKKPSTEPGQRDHEAMLSHPIASS